MDLCGLQGSLVDFSLDMFLVDSLFEGMMILLVNQIDNNLKFFFVKVDNDFGYIMMVVYKDIQKEFKEDFKENNLLFGYKYES